MTLLSIIQCDLYYKVINTLQENVDINIDNDNLSNLRLCGLDIVNEDDNLIKIIKYVDSNLLSFFSKKDSYLILGINNYIILTNLIFGKTNNLLYLSPSQIIDHLDRCKLLFNYNIKRYNNLSFNNLDFIENWDKKIIKINN